MQVFLLNPFFKIRFLIRLVVFVWWSLLEGGTNWGFAGSEIGDFTVKNLVGLVCFGLILRN